MFACGTAGDTSKLGWVSSELSTPRVDIDVEEEEAEDEEDDVDCKIEGRLLVRLFTGGEEDNE